jgi:hypothetical protein
VRLVSSAPGGRANAATCAEMIDAIRAIETVDCGELVTRIEHLVEYLAHEHTLLITIEEGSAGGFRSMVMQHLAWCSLLEKGLKFRLTLPERIIDHDTQAKQYDEARLNTTHNIMTVQTALSHNDVKQHDWQHVWSSTPLCARLYSGDPEVNTQRWFANPINGECKMLVRQLMGSATSINASSEASSRPAPRKHEEADV